MRRFSSGVFPFRLLPFRLLPFRLLPFRLLPFRLLSNVKSVPFRLLSKGGLIFAFDGKLLKKILLKIESTFYVKMQYKLINLGQLLTVIVLFCIDHL